VIDEETGYVLSLGVQFRPGVRIDSLKGCSNRASMRSSSARRAARP